MFCLFKMGGGGGRDKFYFVLRGGGGGSFGPAIFPHFIAPLPVINDQSLTFHSISITY